MQVQNLEKDIVKRVKSIRCEQQDCRSSGTECQEIVVFGEGLKKKGIMCTSCYIDQELLSKIGNPQHHSMSVQKFMKVLTKEYLTYAEMKRKPDWAPNVMEDECERIKGKVISLEKSVEMAIMEVMKFLDDSARQAFQRAKKVNHDSSFEKVYELLQEGDEQEQDRINVSNELKDICLRLEVEHGQYKFTTDEGIRRENSKILLQYRDKVAKGKQTILKLIEILKKPHQHLAG